jgi:hypothetical protein
VWKYTSLLTRDAAVTVELVFAVLGRAGWKVVAAAAAAARDVAVAAAAAGLVDSAFAPFAGSLSDTPIPDSMAFIDSVAADDATYRTQQPLLSINRNIQRRTETHFLTGSGSAASAAVASSAAWRSL